MAGKVRFRLGRDNGGEFIECLRCGWKSYNLYDILERYCGCCHRFHEDRRLVR